MDSVSIKDRVIVVLGATGYVGGRLVPKLLEEGYKVRATGRSLDKLKSRFWAQDKNVELCEVDLHKPDSLRQALKGAHTVYYFVHSMNPQSADFAASDRLAANNMVRISRECDVQSIIYLGGLGEEDTKLSKHLRSRHEVSEILRSGEVPVTILRAAMIIGSGSASFEILRYLVDRLPIMITPMWLSTPNQPIAIRNVINYLFGCLEKEETRGQTYDIGGQEVVTYHDLMHIYAQEAGLPKRIVIPVPVLTPRLSSLWIHLVTPVPSYIARPLAEGLVNPVICNDQSIKDIIPQELLDCREAIKRALAGSLNDDIKTYWADAGEVPKYALSQAGDPDWAGGTLLKDERQVESDVAPEDIWRVVSQIGGKNGWYHATWLWALRGRLDKLFGGVGLRRGRRHPVDLAVGDVVDFWRVIKVVENKQLLLAAEMKLPGLATLEFSLEKNENGKTVLMQKARFKPKGLYGIVYWYILVPFHHYIFGGMIKKIVYLARSKEAFPKSFT